LKFSGEVDWRAERSATMIAPSNRGFINMSLRSVLLRVLFWSLALAAVFGAAGILLGSQDTAWRTSGTAIATALAALAFLGAFPKMERSTARPAALLAVTLVVIEYLLCLTAIWGQWLFNGRWSLDESLWLTVLFVALVGIPAVGLARMTQSALTAVAGRVGLLLAAAELTLLLLIAWDWWTWSRESVAEDLAGWLAPYALLIVVCLIGKGGGFGRARRLSGAALAGIAYSLIAYGSIHDFHSGGEVVVYVTCAAAALAYSNIASLCSLRPTQSWLRWVAISAGVATAVFVSLDAYVDSNGNDLTGRLAGACAVVAGCGIMALLVLARLNRRMVVRPNPMQGLREISVICPVCNKKQTLPLGSAACGGCRVVIHIRVEDPKCASCGYSLLMLESGMCPECGTPVSSNFAAKRIGKDFEERLANLKGV
jgi:hypothetical protein